MLTLVPCELAAPAPALAAAAVMFVRWPPAGILFPPRSIGRPFVPEDGTMHVMRSTLTLTETDLAQHPVTPHCFFFGWHYLQEYERSISNPG